jgi:hypothetical protein
MQQALTEYLRESELTTHWRAVETATTLEAMMAAAWVLARALVLLMMSEVLAARAAQPISWPECPVCGERMQSKGWRPRQWTGVIGTVRWRRRVGRCPQGCKTGQVAPMDQALGLQAHQRTSVGVQELACVLAVLLPFDLARRLLECLAGVVASHEWCMAVGAGAWARGDGAARPRARAALARRGPGP